MGGQKKEEVEEREREEDDTGRIKKIDTAGRYYNFGILQIISQTQRLCCTIATYNTSTLPMFVLSFWLASAMD